MTGLAVPVFAPDLGIAGADHTRPTRYLYEPPSTDDRRRASLTFPSDIAAERRTRLEVATAQINALLTLPGGWDGGTADRIVALAALRAVEWLDQLATPGVPSPHVIPLTDGGVQLEWISGGRSFEIEVDSLGRVGVLGVDAAGNTAIEGESPHPDGTIFVTDAQKFLASIFNSLSPPQG